MGIIYSVLPSFRQTEETVESNPIDEKILSNMIQSDEKIQSNMIQPGKNTFESVEDSNMRDSFQKLIEIPNKKYKKIKYIHNT